MIKVWNKCLHNSSATINLKHTAFSVEQKWVHCVTISLGIPAKCLMCASLLIQGLDQPTPRHTRTSASCLPSCPLTDSPAPPRIVLPGAGWSCVAVCRVAASRQCARHESATYSRPCVQSGNGWGEEYYEYARQGNVEAPSGNLSLSGLQLHLSFFVWATICGIYLLILHLCLP